MLDGSLFALSTYRLMRSPVPRAAKEIKKTPLYPPYKKWGSLFRSPIKIGAPVLPPLKNAAVLLFSDLFRLLWR